jgi:hypothetical protein
LGQDSGHRLKPGRVGELPDVGVYLINSVASESGSWEGRADRLVPRDGEASNRGMTADAPVWYRTLRDVPGAGYAGASSVDRTRLRWGAVEARVGDPSSYLPDDPADKRLEWWYPGETFGSSDSPADRHWAGGREDPSHDSPDGLERRLHEAFELPGTVTDYHFIVMAATTAMEAFARDDPALLSKVEEWCLLDLRITSDHPELFTWVDRDGETRPLRVPACDILARLYRQEGAVREWLEVEERSARLGQGDPDAVRQLLAELEADRG